MIKKILLAEDDRGTALVVKKQLEAKGYQVETAGNGIEALAVLTARTVDLVITDVVMPKMDGVDLFRNIKENPATAHIPIIIVTDKEVFKESFKRLGVSNFIEKSSDINTLLAKILQIEKSAGNARKMSKIIISGNHSGIIQQMNDVLRDLPYLVAVAESSDTLLSKAMLMEPQVIVMDVLFQDKASAPELIKALRCFNALKYTKIITYAFFPDDLGMDVESIRSVENAMSMCTQAGSDMYIGRFNPSFFIERLSTLTI